ncbi:FadR/GntR family transcriptional regulator [Chakrabartyella piscis]|uniref:FadR/GntR family transcriptional regulator n=1 Tax=Chakrabartyella piscis TaxID=2918914 RepID=UPI00295892F9|nr:FadR/GntR family transcriptional regulator [Chakrabartyella piscis]
MKTEFIPKSQVIAKQLEDMIFLEKKYALGERLPNEHELSAQLGVSRSSLREAIKLLAAKDVLTIKRGSGTFVSNTTEEDSNSFGLQYLKDKVKLVASWFEFRQMIEPSAIRLAIKNGSEEELQAIVDSANRMASLEHCKQEEIIKEDQFFHIAIATASHNEILKHIMPSLADAVRDSIVTSTQIGADVKSIDNAMTYHQSIAKFILAKDADGAALAMQYHLTRGINDLKD